MNALRKAVADVSTLFELWLNMHFINRKISLKQGIRIFKESFRRGDIRTLNHVQMILEMTNTIQNLR